METEEIPHPPELRQTYAGQAEDYSSQDKTGGEDADIDSTSCTNSRGSSLSDRRDLDDFDAEGVQDELTQLKTVAALRVMQEGGEERQRSLGFDLNTVCEQGKTLLWDLIQDDNAVSSNLSFVIALPTIFKTIGKRHLCWFHAAKRLLGNFKQPHAVLPEYAGNFQKVRECLGRDEKPRHTSHKVFFPQVFL